MEALSSREKALHVEQELIVSTFTSILARGFWGRLSEPPGVLSRRNTKRRGPQAFPVKELLALAVEERADGSPRNALGFMDSFGLQNA